jgi:2-dehydro-3-deoxyphosphogalactonate aldolase
MSATPPPVATGLIGILRGLRTHEAVDVGQCLYDAGLRTLEVPLNSPDPLASITAMRAALPSDCVVGAGTVLTVEDVRRCRDAGAEVVVSPNTDVAVIAETVRCGMASLPGAATPSEAFAALAAGADGVKVFPAEQVGVRGMRAWTAVLPAGVGLIPVGGIDAGNLAEWWRAGATGFGIGSSLFTPGTPLEELSRRAVALVDALASARG